ncbi:hypothetical protein AAVH_39783 [Aphelenchoides avenae]|nr:hypothetical protein AAVH_39783 [Aphelenchus avenae]
MAAVRRRSRRLPRDRSCLGDVQPTPSRRLPSISSTTSETSDSAQPSPGSPAFGTSKDGRYRKPAAISGRKRFLTEQHALDLWKPTTKPATSAQPPALDYSTITQADAADNAASVLQPTTSANIAATSRASTGPLPADNAARATQHREPWTRADPHGHRQRLFLQRQAEDFQAFQRTLFDQLANQQAVASTSQPKDQKSHHKDQPDRRQ